MLTPMETDGFPELVYAIHDALTDLLGDQFGIDIDALAPELAHTAWKQLRGSQAPASVARRTEASHPSPCHAPCCDLGGYLI